MDQIEKEKLIGKIKKLLALGMKAPETEEAKSAMRKASEMMDRYDLHTIDMNADGTIDDANVVRYDIRFEGKSDWEALILVAIQEAFNCKYVWLKTTNTHTLIGAKTDIEFSSFLFKFVRLQIMKMGDQYRYGQKDLYTYRLGAAMAVKALIHSTFMKPKEEKKTAAAAHSMDLIVVKNAAVARKTQEIFPRLKQGKISSGNGSHDAYRNGNVDGNKVRLNRQLGGSPISGKIN